WNSGNVPIVASDYDQPLALLLGGRLLAADIIDATPPSRKQNAIAGGSGETDFTTIAFHNMVLNKGDSITVQALLTDFDGVVVLSGHIVGVSAMRRVEARRLTRRMAVAILGLTCLNAAAIFVASGSHTAIAKVILTIATVLLGLTFLLLQLYFADRRRIQ